MKISKRILGVALALIMIFNVFAVGTFAAYPDDTLVSLGIATDKAVYAQGETVTITFSAKCLAELQYLQVGGQYEIGYNSAVLEPSSTAATDILAHGFVGIQSGAGTGQASIQMPAGSSGPSALYDWDTTICYCFPDDGTKFDATAGVDLFSITMKIKEDAPNGTYTIGLNPQGYEDYNAYINDGIGLGGLYGTSATDYGFSVPNMYEYGTVTFTVGEEAPAEYDLKHIENQWRESVNVEGAYDVGVKFGFDVSDIDIQFEGTRSTNVARVGAKIYDANGEPVPGTFESEFVYEVGTEYHYRVILEGLAKADDTKFTITPYLVYTDGTNETETITGETVTVCAADVIPQ